MDLISFLNLILVAIGFGFVIFWHELGHFLAAKWAGVRVEQFAIGFGSAIVSYRKGLGFRFGTSGPEYQQILQQEREGLQRADVSAISPTEYRLNWVPLGGYVKMFGQEDMVASTTSTDADHYMNKSVGKRMVIISAGVVMNVILAAILFTVLFFIGYHPQAALIGDVRPGGPADKAGLEVGDRILAINDTPQYAWPHVAISVALLKPGQPAIFETQPAGTEDAASRQRLEVRPEPDPATGMVSVGIGMTPALKGVDPRFVAENADTLQKLFTPDALAVGPGEVVLAVAGTPVDTVEFDDYYILDRAVRGAGAAPVEITVRTLSGAEQTRYVQPRLLDLGETGEEARSREAEKHIYAGLLPLVEVLTVQLDSPNFGKLMPGDVIERIVVVGTADRVSMPSFGQMRQVLGAAGKAGQKVDVIVRRGRETVTLEGLELKVVNRDTGQYGLGFIPAVDSGQTVLGGIAADSPASAAGVPAQGRVARVGGEPVSSWLQVVAHLQGALASGAQSIELEIANGEEVTTHTLALEERAREQIAAVRPDVFLCFISEANPVTTTLKTRNPFQAMWWGVRETKDQIVQLYLTLKRVAVDQTVSPKNLTGPVGIFQFGTVVARNGSDWLIWFFAVISANLAVVNFLPIPILDGGHMVFLASEKITGKPPSPKVQTAALYAGLLLIVGLVLFVTYNDIQRLLM